MLPAVGYRRTLIPSRALGVMAAALSVLALQACGLSPVRSAALNETDDPLEPINRQIFAFNTSISGPLDDVRDDAPSGAVWRGMHNFLVNLREPLTFVNDLAQGRDCAAGASLRRFMVNSSLGVAGIFDVAGELGIEAHDNDFGQTLAVWGFPSGPYIVLPVLGPSDLRAVSGTAVEFFADPVDLAWRSAGLIQVALPLAGADFVDRQLTGTDELNLDDRRMPDQYVALREAYRRNLAASVTDDKCMLTLRQSDPYSGYWHTSVTPSSEAK